MEHSDFYRVAKGSNSVPKTDPCPFDVVPTYRYFYNRNTKDTGDIKVLHVKTEPIQLLQGKNPGGCRGVEKLETALGIAERQSGHETHHRVEDSPGILAAEGLPLAD